MFGPEEESNNPDSITDFEGSMRDALWGDFSDDENTEETEETEGAT